CGYTHRYLAENPATMSQPPRCDGRDRPTSLRLLSRCAIMPHQMPEHAVSIATSFDYGLPIEAQLHAIAEAGFTHFSLGANESHSGCLTVEGRQRLRALAQTYGLGIDTIHGPRADVPESLAALHRVVLAAAELGVPVVVVHGGPFDFPHAELEWRLQDLLR